MADLPLRPLHRFRWYANFINLSTPIGLVIAKVSRARVRPGPRGLVLAEGYRFAFPIASAFTVGNVVITASDFGHLSRRHPALLDHEEQHAWQWLFCLGLPFLPLYLLAMGWSWLRTGNRASSNVFEQLAGLAEGGYMPPRLDTPTRMPSPNTHAGWKGASGLECAPEGKEADAWDQRDG